MEIKDLLRDNIKALKPYSTARDEYQDQADIFLDANENAHGSATEKAYNRYPDPKQALLKERISQIKGIPPRHIFIGNGSDEAIDLLIRAFCEPKRDNIIVLPPTYGMYEVAAAINAVTVKKVPLAPDFQLDLDSIAEQVDAQTKIIFICSPNNPTGNAIDPRDVEVILNNFEGIVVVDEAYINFSRQSSMIRELTEYPNLVVLQTFSKAWGLAGLRVGMAFASLPVVEVLNKIKSPYNISQPSQEEALEALNSLEKVNNWIKDIVRERNKLANVLAQLDFVVKVFPSDANFLLVQVKDADKMYTYLLENGVIVRDRSKLEECKGCIRITIGTTQENQRLIDLLQQFNTL